VVRLACLPGQRYWVERRFQDGKGEAGLDHDQARGWLSWHHHMALVAMALLFMLEERLTLHEHLPLLSGADITRLLAEVLPRRNRTLEELIQHMQIHHGKRQASIDAAYAKQRLVCETG
jgi:hypothetical protein